MVGAKVVDGVYHSVCACGLVLLLVKGACLRDGEGHTSRGAIRGIDDSIAPWGERKRSGGGCGGVCCPDNGLYVHTGTDSRRLPKRVPWRGDCFGILFGREPPSDLGEDSVTMQRNLDMAELKFP